MMRGNPTVIRHHPNTTGLRVTGRLGTAEVGKMRSRGTIGIAPGALCNVQNLPSWDC